MNHNIVLEKAYVRYYGNLPNNENTFAAAHGFDMMGVQIVPFYDVTQIESFDDLGPRAIICGNIADILVALKKMGAPKPDELDYPNHLDWFLGRNIKRMCIEDVRRGTQRIFVKPVTQKLFTGLVWEPENYLSRIVLAPYEYDTPVIVSDVVEFISEWRCFVKYDNLIAAKHYKGDWSKSPDISLINKAVHLGKGKMPAAYALDVGVTSDGKTLLVEANEGYALGCYGLPSIVYASFLEARWQQFVA